MYGSACKHWARPRGLSRDALLGASIEGARGSESAASERSLRRGGNTPWARRRDCQDHQEPREPYQGDNTFLIEADEGRVRPGEHERPVLRTHALAQR